MGGADEASRPASVHDRRARRSRDRLEGTHYIIPRGLFAMAFSKLAASGWRLNLAVRRAQARKRRRQEQDHFQLRLMQSDGLGQARHRGRLPPLRHGYAARILILIVRTSVRRRRKGMTGVREIAI